MTYATTFGANIESILGDILVKKTKLEELLLEIHNLSSTNIDKSNELVDRLMAVVQVIDERTKEIEIKYSQFLSVRNNFLDMTDWDEKIYPEIKSVFEDELSRYLEQLLGLESICETFFVTALEQKQAENNTLYNLDHNVYKNDPSNNERMKNYMYGESIGYGWYSVKASDAYLRDQKSVLNVVKFDDTKWSELKSICKGSVLHETITFHPDFGLMHITTNSRERVVSSFVEEETQSQFFTYDMKNFDGFEGEMNEIKGSYFNRPIIGIDRENIKNKADLAYGLIIRHKIADNPEINTIPGEKYFIMKMRDYEPLKSGTPDNFLIQRSNLELLNMQRDYEGTSGSTTQLALNNFLATYDQDFTEIERVKESRVDDNEKLIRNKIVNRIVKASYYTNTISMNIKGSDIKMLLRYQYGQNGSSASYMDFVTQDTQFNKFTLTHFIRENGKFIKDYDLFANLVLQVMPLEYTHIGQQYNLLRDYPKIKQKGILFTNEKFQLVNSTNHGFYDSLTVMELGTYSKPDDIDAKIPSGTLLEKMIKIKGNSQIHKLLAFNLIEYYDIFANPLRRNNYYFAPYTKSNNYLIETEKNKIVPKIVSNYHINYINNYSMIEDEKDYTMGGYIEPKQLVSGIFCENIAIRGFSNMLDDGHVIAFGTNLPNLYYSEDYGLTWKKATIDYANSPYKAQNPLPTTGTTFWGSIQLQYNGMSFIGLNSGVNHNTFLRTKDYGKTWTVHNYVLGAQCIDSIHCNGKGLVVSTVYSTDKIGISKDGGDTWTSFTMASKGHTGIIDGHEHRVFDDGTIHLLLNQSNTQCVFESKDEGKTWKRIAQNGQYVAHFANDSTPRKQFLGTWWEANKCAISTDGGKTWINRTMGPGQNNSVPLAKMTLDGFVIYTNGTNLIINSNFMASTAGNSSISISRSNAPFALNEKHKMILVQDTNNIIIRRYTYYTEKLNYRHDIIHNRAQEQKIGRLASLTNIDFENIKEELVKRLIEYNTLKSKTYIGTYVFLPYEIENEEFFKFYGKCDGRYVSKIEFPDAYKIIGDRYATDEGEEVPEGYFRLPNLCGRTMIGTDNEELLGTNIENCLPNSISFTAQMGDNSTEESKDARYGPIAYEPGVSETRTGLLGGFEEGMDRSKIKINHNSTSQITKGNYFHLDVYIRLK